MLELSLQNLDTLLDGAWKVYKSDLVTPFTDSLLQMAIGRLASP